MRAKRPVWSSRRFFEVVPGTQIVAVVTNLEEAVPGFRARAPGGRRIRSRVRQRIRDRVRGQLRGRSRSDPSRVSCSASNGAFSSNPIVVEDGDVVGALVVARHGRTWSGRERSLTKAFCSLLSHVATLATREGRLLHQRRLDELVAQVAERLMSASATNRQEVLDWVCQVLAEFLNADVAFIRRNDLTRGVTILEAEWPIREDNPDPDPLGEVSFDADPIFMALRDMTTPYLTGHRGHHRRVSRPGPRGRRRDARRRRRGSAAARRDSTWGVLGFLHFNLHSWVPAEINALQAVASMLVQLQGRIDAEERTRYNANHDELTGLPNRRALIQELKTRLDANRQTAVMVIDLDRFKIMNDYLGSRQRVTGSSSPSPTGSARASARMTSPPASVATSSSSSSTRPRARWRCWPRPIASSTSSPSRSTSPAKR